MTNLMSLYSLPKDKFLDLSKLKAFADDKINVNQKQKFFLGWVENIAGKEDKRAMMALDRSPEAFSPQMNSTFLFLWFQLVTPGVGPVLIPRGIIE